MTTEDSIDHKDENLLWWILETTAKSEMDLEKQKPAERTLSPPEVEVER